MDNTDSPADALQNFDPKRSHSHVTTYLSLDVHKEGIVVGTLLMPETMLTGKSEDEIQAAAHHVLSVYELAADLIDHDKALSMTDVLVDGVVGITAYLIVGNIASVYLERMAQESSSDTVTLEFEADWPPTFEELLSKHSAEKIQPILREVFVSKSTKEGVCLSIWKHIFAGTLLTIEEEKGCWFQSLGEGEREIVFYEYFDRDLEDNLQEAASIVSQQWARVALDALDIVRWSNDRLTEFLGFRIRDSQPSTASSSKLADAHRLLGILARRNPTADIEIVLSRDDKPALHLPADYAPRLKELLTGAIIQDLFRERQYTKEHVRKLLLDKARLLGESKAKLTKKALATYLDVSRTTLDHYFDEDPELWAKIQDAFVTAKFN